MKQIKINETIISLAQKYQSNFSKEKEKILRDLVKLKLVFIEETKCNYIDNIIKFYDEIIVAQPNEIRNKWKLIFNELKTKDDFKFSTEIIKVMNYKIVRKEYFIYILKELEINTCIYCHSQSTLTVNNQYYKRKYKDNIKGDVKSQKSFLELDHYFSQKKYPFLCTSFFNLYPVCSNCNKSKSSKELLSFELYHSNKEDNKFKFGLTDESKVKYCATNNKKDIEIILNHSNEKIKKEFNDVFNVELIYNEHKDIVEELYHKHFIYNDVYIKSLEKLLHSGNLNQPILKRIILGNYTEEEDIHKRPLAKFYQDIFEELKNIKQ
jgi:hypothetical protein